MASTLRAPHIKLHKFPIKTTEYIKRLVRNITYRAYWRIKRPFRFKEKFPQTRDRLIRDAQYMNVKYLKDIVYLTIYMHHLTRTIIILTVSHVNSVINI
jgi:hypothetical protein